MARCEVCLREQQTDVAASTLGAWSIAICQDCLDHDAEPMGDLVASLDCGCTEDDLKDYKTYQNGRYVRFGDREQTAR